VRCVGFLYTTRLAKLLDPASSTAWLAPREKGVDELLNDTQVKEFLEKVKVDELFKDIGSAKKMTSEQTQAVIGKFNGQVIFDDPKIPPRDVGMRLDQDGPMDIKMFKQGAREAFSHASGSTGDKNFQGFSGGSQAILVNVYGDDGYLQLYPSKGLGYLIGNYYERKGLTSFQRAGTISLHRSR